MQSRKRDTTALVKDLELQIDYLCGYAPTGNHWKQEYYIRKELIDNTLLDENTPKEIRDKIYRIQESLYKLQTKQINDQGYVKYSQNENIPESNFPINDWHDKTKSDFKELPDELKDKRDWRRHDPYIDYV